MSKKSESKTEADAILEKISSVIQPISKKVDKSEDHALLVIAVSSPDSQPITTFTIATGLFDVISRGLHAELADQLDNGQLGLFQAIQQVIHELEAEFGIAQENQDGRAHLH